MRFSIANYILRPSRKQILQDLRAEREIIEGGIRRIEELMAELKVERDVVDSRGSRIEELVAELKVEREAVNAGGLCTGRLTAELNAVRKMLEKEQKAHADTRGRFQQHRRALEVRLKAISSVFCGTPKAKPADLETNTPAEQPNPADQAKRNEEEPFEPVVDERRRAEITSRIPSETDLRLLTIDPPAERPNLVD